VDVVSAPPNSVLLVSGPCSLLMCSGGTWPR
jgi:hypothetical protein